MPDGQGVIEIHPTPPATGLVKGLGLLDSTALVAGSMIGSGIFIVSADIARQVKSPGLLLVVWLVTGLITVLGALSYGELAAAMPRAGGQYVYLRESLGPLWGFLYGWSMLLVIQTATIAAVAIAFARFTAVLWPWFSPEDWIWKIGKIGPYEAGLNRQNLLAIACIVFLTLLNTRGLRVGAVVQTVFTVAKTGALLGLIVLGLLFSVEAARRANFEDFWRQSSPVGEGGWLPLLTVISVAMVGSLFSSDAWNTVTFTAGEVKDPARNLPLSLAIGTGTVALLYLLANVAYLNVLPFEGHPAGGTAFERGIQHAAQDRVGTAAAEVIFGGGGATIMAVAVMVSTFGCKNGLILAGGRIFYAMARDGLFFRFAGRLNRRRVPGNALVVQCLWASLLCLSGTYNQLLDFLIPTVLLFYVLTIAGLFVLRGRRPDLPRPYRALGYPVLPALYIVAALFIAVQLLRAKPDYSWPGLLVVLAGVPVYWIWLRRPAPAPAARPEMEE